MARTQTRRQSHEPIPSASRARARRLMREENATLSLDGEWDFIPDPERLYTAQDLPPGEPIAVPGCWEAQVAHPYRIVTAWYRRSFDAPADWDGSRLLIHFGAVMYRCAVWLNGERIGEHEGGYTAFAVDAADAVRWGAANELVVEVENPLNAIADYPAFAAGRVLDAEALTPDLPLSEIPHGKQTWYSSQSGLWQSVRAERVGACHIDALVVFPDVPAERATVRWRVLGDRAGARLELRALGPDGREVGTAQADLGPAEGETSVAVPEPVLWGIGAPNLYRLEARILLAGREQDRLTTRFGMREVGVRDGAVTLNGEPVYLLGVLDQDLYPDTISTPPSRAYLDEQLRRARELGFNILRCHIKVPDPAYLDAADEAGMLVWCELPNWSRFTHASAGRGLATLSRMVETVGSHPSVVMWTIINEDWGTRLRHERRDRAWLRRTYEWAQGARPDPPRRRQLGLRDGPDAELPRQERPRGLPPLLRARQRHPMAEPGRGVRRTTAVALEPPRRRRGARGRAARPQRVRRLGAAGAHRTARR